MNEWLPRFKEEWFFMEKFVLFESEKLAFFLSLNTVTIRIDMRKSCEIQLHESVVLLWPQKDVIRQPYSILGCTS